MPGIGAIAVVVCLRMLGLIGNLATLGLISTIFVVSVAITSFRYKENPKEGIPDEGDGGFSVKAALRVMYKDSNGVLTDREVVVNRYVPGSPGHIEAFCRLRKGNRTFRLDRIQEAVDIESGEVIPVRRIRSWLKSHEG